MNQTTVGAEMDLRRRTHIRWQIRRDMLEVVAIERASCPLPWSEEDFLHAMRQRNTIGMVAEVSEQVVGMMVYELHKGWLSILKFAVHPDFRRRGVGEVMLDKLKSNIGEKRTRDRICLEVRETNLAGLLFLRAQHFRATGVVREHYEDTGEDAFTMEYTAPRGEGWL